MKRRDVVMVLGLFVFTGGALAAQNRAPADPVTGVWSDDGNKTAKFDLAYDGKRAVTGTIGTPKGPAEIKTGTFDKKTGALKLEGEATAPDGAPVKYLIVGTIKGGVAEGSWQFGAAKGSYRMTRKAVEGKD